MTAAAKGDAVSQRKIIFSTCFGRKGKYDRGRSLRRAEISHETAEPSWFSRQTVVTKVESSMSQGKKLLLGSLKKCVLPAL